LFVAARSADDVRAPTFLIIRADRDADPGAHVEIQVTSAGEAATADVSGGVYALRVHVNAPVADNATLADVAPVAQFVEYG
jgi:hypothetical protein